MLSVALLNIRFRNLLEIEHLPWIRVDTGRGSLSQDCLASRIMLLTLRQLLFARVAVPRCTVHHTRWQRRTPSQPTGFDGCQG